jgi:hypothetical protein
MTTTTESTKITARAKAFSREGVREHRFRIDADGTVRVWDSLAGHFTTCHIMSQATQKRIAKLAGK